MRGVRIAALNPFDGTRYSYSRTHAHTHMRAPTQQVYNIIYYIIIVAVLLYPHFDRIYRTCAPLAHPRPPTHRWPLHRWRSEPLSYHPPTHCSGYNHIRRVRRRPAIVNLVYRCRYNCILVLYCYIQGDSNVFVR